MVDVILGDCLGLDVFLW